MKECVTKDIFCIIRIHYKCTQCIWKEMLLGILKLIWTLSLNCRAIHKIAMGLVVVVSKVDIRFTCNFPIDGNCCSFDMC